MLSQDEVKAVREEATVMREEAEDSKERQSELQNRLNKAIAEVTVWHQKCQENESLFIGFIF